MAVRSLRRGFTLAETFMVLTIIGVVLAIGLPKIDYGRYKADANVVVMRSLLQQAHRDAIVLQHDLIVSVDTSGHRLILSYDKDNNGILSGSERIRIQALTESGKFATPPSGKFIPSGATTGGNGAYGDALRSYNGLPSVVFRRDGSTTSTLEIYVTTVRKTPKDFRCIAVIIATGRADWYRFGGTDWRLGY